MKYFARLTHGLESVGEIDLKRVRGVKITSGGYRRIDFTYHEKPYPLLALRSVDDVYVYVDTLEGVGHTREALKQISEFAARFELGGALTVLGELRTVPDAPTYAITATLRGNRNYSRFESADAIAAGLRQHHWAREWTRLDTGADVLMADVHFRVVIEDGAVMVGVQLADAPLHRRTYLLETHPGGLKPPVAYCLCLLAEIGRGDVVLDGLGGVGTIMIEAERGFHPRLALVSDRSEVAVRAAVRNAGRANSTIRAWVGDAGNVPLDAGSVDRYVTDLPWGRQVTVDEGIEVLYGRAMREVGRLLRVGGRAVILTEHGAVLSGAVEDAGLAVVGAVTISLYGSLPTAYVIAR